MSFPIMDDEYLGDIVKVFLLGINTNTNTKDENGVPIPDVIARSYPRDDPRYFPYIVEWKQLFELRKRMVKVLSESDDTKLNLLALAIKLIHE